MDKALEYYEENVLIPVLPKDVFNFADNHNNFSSHMNISSWVMGGGKWKPSLMKVKGRKLVRI